MKAIPYHITQEVAKKDFKEKHKKKTPRAIYPLKKCHTEDFQGQVGLCFEQCGLVEGVRVCGSVGWN